MPFIHNLELLNRLEPVTNVNQKILFVTDTLFPIGPAYQLRLLAQSLCRAGLEIHIAVLSGSDGIRNELPEGVEVHFLRKRARRDYGALFRLRKLVQRLVPTHVHSWGVQALSVTTLALQATACRQVGTILEVPHQRSLFFRLAGDRLTRDICLTASHSSIVEHMKHEFWVDDSRSIEIIPNASAPLRIDRQESRDYVQTHLGLTGQSPILIGGFAEWHQRTRLKDLIWAADLLCCIRDDVHLLLFGSGVQERRLKKFCEMTDARSHIHFPSFDAMAGFGSLDIFWQSHLTEPEPSGVLAAMAYGIPTVCILGTGAEKVLDHQASALAVNFGARDEFARWSKYLIECPGSATEIAKQGQQHVARNFKVDDMVGRYRELYQA